MSLCLFLLVQFLKVLLFIVLQIILVEDVVALGVAAVLVLNMLQEVVVFLFLCFLALKGVLFELATFALLPSQLCHLAGHLGVVQILVVLVLLEDCASLCRLLVLGSKSPGQLLKEPPILIVDLVKLLVEALLVRLSLRAPDDVVLFLQEELWGCLLPGVRVARALLGRAELKVFIEPSLIVLASSDGGQLLREFDACRLLASVLLGHYAVQVLVQHILLPFWLLRRTALTRRPLLLSLHCSFEASWR